MRLVKYLFLRICGALMVIYGVYGFFTGDSYYDPIFNILRYFTSVGVSFIGSKIIKIVLVVIGLGVFFYAGWLGRETEKGVG